MILLNLFFPLSSKLKKTAPAQEMNNFPPNSKYASSLPRKHAGGFAGFHQCEICGKYGHFAKNCLSAPQQELRMSNLPRANVRKVVNLDGIDVSNKTVIKNTDGTFDIFEPSASGLDQIKRDTQFSKLNLSEVPDHLKCSLTGALLTEAVELPCCKKIVNDSAIRESLMKSALKCPLCHTLNVSPDSVSLFSHLLWFIKTKSLSYFSSENLFSPFFSTIFSYFLVMIFDHKWKNMFMPRPLRNRNHYY
jgi:hypothetical protein